MRRVVQYSQIDSIGVSGDKKGLHWYQWYDWYQWKSTLFQWFCWWICISLRGLRLFSDVVWLGTGQFQWPPLVPTVRLVPMEKHPFQWFYWWICIWTIGMTSFSIGTNPTTGTNGPSVWRIVSVCVYWTCVEYDPHQESELGKFGFASWKSLKGVRQWLKCWGGIQFLSNARKWPEAILF